MISGCRIVSHSALAPLDVGGQIPGSTGSYSIRRTKERWRNSKRVNFASFHHCDLKVDQERK